MKKILFDLTATQPSGDSKRHGGGRYGEIVFRRILERRMPVDCFYDSGRWMNPELFQYAQMGGVNFYDVKVLSLDDIVNSSGADTIYSALPSVKLFKYTKCKLIGTIHGLRRLETPPTLSIWRYKSTGWKDYGSFLFNFLMPRTYQRFLCWHKKREWERQDFHFVTVSQHTANAIKVYFPSLRNRDIPVFYSPSTCQETPDLQRKHKEKFFLLVSANRPEKNSLKAIMALDKLYREGFLDGYRVKVTGVKAASGFRYKIVTKDRFEFLGYVDDADLEQLYHDAYCLIYPSLNEGFGYPPLEAMRYGVPVIASPFTSIPEICQGAAIYFNPNSPEEIANRILSVVDSGVWKKYSDLSRQRFSEVSKKQKEDLDALIDYIYRKA